MRLYFDEDAIQGPLLRTRAQRRFEIGEAVRRLVGISTRHTPESMRGQVIYLSTWRPEQG